MADLFGTPQGQSLAEQDMARLAMTNAQVQHMGVQDMMAPSTAQQRSASARWLNTRAAAAERDIEVQKKVAALAAGKDWSEDERKNPGWTFANLYMEAGSPREAMKVAGQAATIDSRTAAADTNAARASLIQARTRIAQIDTLSRSMRTVDSPETLQAALQRHEQTTGEQTGLLDQQGNLAPQAVEKWEEIRDQTQEMALTEKDRIATDVRERALASAEKERTSRQEARTFWQSMDNQRKRAEAQAAARVQKAGKIEKPDKTLGTNFVNSQFIGIDSNQAKVFGAQIAEQAQQFRTLNPALTPTEATQQAFDAMEKQGTFQGLKRTPPGALQSKDRPLPLPADVDKAKLKTGFWYTDGKTKMQWLGPDKGWDKKQTQGGSGKIRAAAAGTYIPPADDAEDLENDEADNMALDGVE